ncbi:MAG: hypothetical protein ACLQU5_29005 [Isosphaeraceae bacterium]
MNGRASRRHWIRNRAWAVIAALLPASECLAVSDTDPAPPNSKQSDTSESGQSGSRGAPGTTARTRIPPPRIFSEQELKGGQAVRSEIPPASRVIPDPKKDRLADEPNRLESRTQPRGSQALVDIAPSSPGPVSNTGPSPGDLLTPVSPGPTMVAPEAAPSVKGQTAKEHARQATSTQAAAPDSTVNQVAEPKATLEGSPEATPLGTDAVVRQALNILGAAPSGPQAPSPDSSPAASRVQAPGDAPVAPASPQPEPELKQSPASSEGRNPDKSPERKQDGQVEQSSCATCGGFHGQLDGHVFSQAGCASGNCIPGRQPCNPPLNECDTVVGGFLTNLYQCICCPDPCYEPKWVPAAYASFFADYARPRTVTRLRYDNLEDMTQPDRNQFWINNVTPIGSRLPRKPISNLFARLQQVYLYQEAAGPHGSLFVEVPYRQINESWAPTQAGFGDINFGIKSLLFDCEMLQIAFQMRTFMPSGNFMNNLGNGQFALDPSILTSLKLGPTTYFQGQFGNWVPLGGPGVQRAIAGGIFYWFMSLNQVLCYTTPDSPLIATLEMDGWSFQNGGYIPTILPSGNIPHPIPHDSGISFFNIGPGLRQSICNRVDFGGAITWATNSTAHWAQPWFRFEVRFLF